MSVLVKSEMPSVTSMKWKDLNFWRSPSWTRIKEILSLQGKNVTPRKQWIFRPFILTPLEKVKVVFLFPEPYTGDNVANGLALSCTAVSDPFELWKTPFFFSEIILEARADVKIKAPRSGDLSPWAKQGVLLLNSRLTTVIGHSNGHLGLGWQMLTREVIETLYLQNPKIVFVFFGEHVLPYKEFLPADAITFEVPLPSPMKMGPAFAGCRMFSKINHTLRQNKVKPIDWRLR